VDGLGDKSELHHFIFVWRVKNLGKKAHFVMDGELTFPNNLVRLGEVGFKAESASLRVCDEHFHPLSVHVTHYFV